MHVPRTWGRTLNVSSAGALRVAGHPASLARVGQSDARPTAATVRTAILQHRSGESKRLAAATDLISDDEASTIRQECHPVGRNQASLAKLCVGPFFSCFAS